MDGLLPPSMFPREGGQAGSSSSSEAKRSNIPEQLGSSARARPQAPPRNRSHQVKAPPTQDGDRGTVEIVWCGDPEAILAVSVDGCLETWIPSQMGQHKVRLPWGEHHCKVEEDGLVKLDETFTLQGDAAQRKTLMAGRTFEETVEDPSRRSQFSFEGGRSACTFLAVEAAAHLRKRLLRADAGSCVVPEDIQAVLDRGMRRYLEEGGKDSLEAMGLEHANVAEVLEFFPAYGSEWSTDQDQTFWGNLLDPTSVEDVLEQLSRLARPGQGAVFACLTRPPESVLIVCFPEAGLYGVLDTHMRFIGPVKVPAAFYRCSSIAQLASLVRHTLFPLPPGCGAEELGMYAMFEMTRLVSKSQDGEADDASDVESEEELDPDSVSPPGKPSRGAGVGELIV